MRSDQPSRPREPGQVEENGPWIGSSPQRLAQRYYDATTWIYRWAWGSSFHFSPLRKNETRRASIRRYEEQLATALDARPGLRCLDLGCGVGGPALTIQSLTKARIVGLNSNLGQLRLLERSLSRRKQSSVALIGADFAQLPFRENAFDRAYAFEALCHAVDLDIVFREIFRVLSPGGVLGFSEWCLTEKFDPLDEAHRALEQAIERSYGIVRLRPWAEWQSAIRNAGFHIVETVDRAQLEGEADARDPWYRALLPRDQTFDSFARKTNVRTLAEVGLRLAECCRLAPRGTTSTVRQLREGTMALVEAGRREVFTPMRFVLATKVPAEVATHQGIIVPS